MKAHKGKTLGQIIIKIPSFPLRLLLKVPDNNTANVALPCGFVVPQQHLTNEESRVSLPIIVMENKALDFER